MESNPAYGFVQENISSHLPAIENTYEQVQRPHTIEVSADKKITARNNETLKLKVRKIADKSIVGVVAAIVAVLALVIAIVAIIVAETDHSNPEIQSRVEIENLREMLNDTLGLTGEVQELRNMLREDLKLLLPTGTFFNPATSCSDTPPYSPSREYWIQNNNTNIPVQMYCDMNPRNCSCYSNSTGGWTRVAKLDMTDPSQQCPVGFSLKTSTSPHLRLCGGTGTVAGCLSTIFPVYGIEYSHVCGRVVGYQYGAPFAFLGADDIDRPYVDGVSLTYGPRQHIWTFAAGSDDTNVGNTWVCPCSGSTTATVPSFVGEDYFCETANHVSGYMYSTPFYGHPLWAGHQCATRPNDQCCSFNSPPWFCKELSLPTTHDIELRLCNSQSPQSSDTPFEVVEIYVK